MENEAWVLQRIAERFPQVEVTSAVTATRRIYWDIDEAWFMPVLEYCATELGFSHLCTITGLDTGSHYEFLYHISNLDGILLTLKRRTNREDPVTIPSVLPIYPCATFYERELEGLLGVHVEGLPEGRQYPLPDNWPAGQYPMRKDWTPAHDGDKA